MANFDMTQVKQLRGASDEKSANELLEVGWVLIDTSSGKAEDGYPFTRYSLAWVKDAPPPSKY